VPTYLWRFRYVPDLARWPYETFHSYPWPESYGRRSRGQENRDAIRATLPVPVANLIWLAVDRESGEAVV
jgi:hypothetical protein